MIIRVLDEGQFEVGDPALGELEELDAKLDSAIGANDAANYHEILTQMLAIVRGGGLVPPDRIVASDLVLPNEHLDLDEVRILLSSEEAS